MDYGMRDHQKLATQSDRAPPKYAEQVATTIHVCPVRKHGQVHVHVQCTLYIVHVHVHVHKQSILCSAIHSDPTL